MSSEGEKQERESALFPSIRLVSLQRGQRTETPLSCIPDPPLLRCIPDPPIPSCPCVLHRSYCPGVFCTCDCAGDCACDIHVKYKPPCNCDPLHSCYCVSKKGLSPDTQLPPEVCGAHARTFFRLAENED